MRLVFLLASVVLLLMLEGSSGIKLQSIFRREKKASESCPPRSVAFLSLNLGEGVLAARSVVNTCLLGMPRTKCAGRSVDLKATKTDDIPSSQTAECRQEVVDAAMNPAARGLALIAVAFLGLLRYIVGLWDKMAVMMELLSIQTK